MNPAGSAALEGHPMEFAPELSRDESLHGTQDDQRPTAPDNSGGRLALPRILGVRPLGEGSGSY